MKKPSLGQFSSSVINVSFTDTIKRQRNWLINNAYERNRQAPREIEKQTCPKVAVHVIGFICVKRPCCEMNRYGTSNTKASNGELSHNHHPAPGPPMWDQMVSKLRFIKDCLQTMMDAVVFISAHIHTQTTTHRTSHLHTHNWTTPPSPLPLTL